MGQCRRCLAPRQVTPVALTSRLLWLMVRRMSSSADPLLPDVVMWTLEARSLGAHEHLPFVGWIVRGALGRALQELSCTRGCGRGPCRARAEGSACTYASLFEHGGVPRFRLDTSELDGRSLRDGEAFRLRLVTFDGTASPMFAEALRRAVERGLGDRGVGAAVSSLRPDVPDPWRRAAMLGERFLVELRTPTEIGRGEGWIEAPTPLDVLHATRARMRMLGLDDASLPPFGDEVRHHVAWMSPWRGSRWSARRQAWVPMRGARAGFKVLATPAQAVWFSLAELLGVGAGTAFGMGAVRLIQEG